MVISRAPVPSMAASFSSRASSPFAPGAPPAGLRAEVERDNRGALVVGREECPVRTKCQRSNRRHRRTLAGLRDGAGRRRSPGRHDEERDQEPEFCAANACGVLLSVPYGTTTGRRSQRKLCRLVCAHYPEKGFGIAHDTAPRTVMGRRRRPRTAHRASPPAIARAKYASGSSTLTLIVLCPLCPGRTDRCRPDRP